MNPPRSRSGRGTAGLAVVIVLVILQLLLVGVMIGGARDQDLSVHRLNTTRALYAAEAGANMALRELMNNADEEGDGGIGTISNDGNAANDPALGTTRFYVNAATVGIINTLTSRGRSGAARRQTDEIVEVGTMAGPGPAMLAFSRFGNDQPRYSLWNGSAWGASVAMPNIGGVANFLVLRDCPKRNEAMCVTQDDAKDINALIYNGASWSPPTELCISTGQTTNRPFDAAYEQLSGDGLVAYWKNETDQIGYRTYNGSVLSSEVLLSAGGASASTYMALFAQPRTNNIILLFENTNGGIRRLSGAVWNGTAWGNWTQLTTTSIASTSNECFSLAFEGLSNRAVCVYGENNTTSPRYRTWNGAGWSAEGSLPGVSAEPQWLRLEADPSSNRILVGIQCAASSVYVNNWTGTGWGSQVQVESNVRYTSRRQFDLVFERATGRGLVVYSEQTQNALRYRTWNGAAWSAELVGANVGDTQGTVQVRAGPTMGEAFIAVQNDSSDLQAVQWGGAAMSAATLIESSLGGPTSTEAFMLALPGAGTKPKVMAWKEVQPQ